jgi:hypothetical protein
VAPASRSVIVSLPVTAGTEFLGDHHSLEKPTEWLS